MLTLEDRDFQRLVNYIHSNYGIDLSQKRQLIIGRLSSVVQEMGFTSFEQYTDHILNKHLSADIEVLLNKLTTNYTFFMREKAHFDYLKGTILPWVESTKKDKVLSIWSAGCSFGHEPYTLSMITKDYFEKKSGKWDTRVLATDISQNALSNAMRGVYPKGALAEVPDEWKKKFFRMSPNGNDYEVTQDLKANVIFRKFNLMDKISFKLKFDVIFCRNVMIYFDKETRDALTKRFYDATNPGGYLLIGHSEGLNDNTHGYEYVASAVYRKPL